MQRLYYAMMGSHINSRVVGSTDDEHDEANTMSILIATDNHLGYLEGDPIRGSDSFRSFEEILQLAKSENVDAIFLAGDLFHDNKPSRSTLYNTMLLLRHYCLGDRPQQIELLSDQSINFPGPFPIVNYQDPNYNIAIPTFSIHGNHDDPSGDGNHCALDILHVSGLVNYFGKQQNVDDIKIPPLLMRKGTTKLALYGLGNVRDERLVRSFRKDKVTFLLPKREEGEKNDWFNLFMIHQNRVKHGPSNYIPETFLAPFLNLVIWGHEHDCRIDPEHNEQQEFFVSQPGSSVATSLSEGESIPKHVGLLKISNTDFQLNKIRLRTVRPFTITTVELSSIEDLDPLDSKAVLRFLHEKCDGLIKQALDEYKELNPEVEASNVPKPLVRLRVDYTGGFTTFNPQRFGQAFVDRVANPKDLI
ncbi:Double-strand break repair protein mre11a, partial [Nowakowskiella sp. JEL0078]